MVLQDMQDAGLPQVLGMVRLCQLIDLCHSVNAQALQPQEQRSTAHHSELLLSEAEAVLSEGAFSALAAHFERAS